MGSRTAWLRPVVKSLAVLPGLRMEVASIDSYRDI
jgi:hypothetical protein